MTRKRYVKLLMAMGVPRNVATRGAAYARKRGTPYEVDLEILKIFREIVCKKVMDELERAILYGTGPAPLGTFANPVTMDFIPPKPQTEYKLRLWPEFGPVQERAFVRINKITDVSLVPNGGYPLGGDHA